MNYQPKHIQKVNDSRAIVDAAHAPFVTSSDLLLLRRLAAADHRHVRVLLTTLGPCLKLDTTTPFSPLGDFGRVHTEISYLRGCESSQCSPIFVRSVA